MFVVDVIRLDRQRVEIREQVCIQPAVDFQAAFVSFLECQCEWIEGRGLVFQLDRTWFNTGFVVRVAASANLHDQSVEAVVGSGVDELMNFLRRGEGGPYNPQRPNFLRRRQRTNERQEDCELRNANRESHVICKLSLRTSASSAPLR